METASKFVKVRVEEIGIGVALGVGTGLAVASPFAMGLPSLNPLSAAIGFVGFAQACVVWGCAIAGGAVGGYWAARQERDSHVRGAHYIPDYTEAAHALQSQQRASFSEKQSKGEVHGLSLGGVELARSQEVRHIVLVGTTGSGKTATLNSILRQALERGDRVILHDPKGDYTTKYYDPNTTALLGPWDDRAVLWNAAEDIGTPALADEFAQAACGDVTGQNKSFYDNAGTVVSGLIKSFMVESGGWTWRDLAAALALPARALAERAAMGDPRVHTAIPSIFAGGKLSVGDSAVLSIIQAGTKWIPKYAAVYRPAAQNFSITKWLLREAHQNVRLLILNNNETYSKDAQGIFGSVLRSAVAIINSAAMPERSPDEPDGLCCILDELPQIGSGAMEAMQKVYELGRSRGIRAVLAMQAESQLAAAIGADKAKPMTEVQGTHIYLQLGKDNAKEVSETVGEREVNRVETTSENGALSGKTKKLVTQRVILPSELMALQPRPPRGVEMVLHIGGLLGKLLQPFEPKRPDVAPALVESEAWTFGTLPGWLEKHRPAAETKGPEGEAVPQQPAPPADAIDPADLPFDPPPHDPLDI